ncbi:MAG: TldD/PmbA family protein [Vicinamibacterales bacterium]
MASTRREFIRTTATAAAALAASPQLRYLASAQAVAAPAADSATIEIGEAALDAARSAGATYADVRVTRYRRQAIYTREQQVRFVADNESYGLGIRALVNGSWGFAATSRVTRGDAQQAALQAAALARAAERVRRQPVELAPVQPVTGTWMTPLGRDPFLVPIEEKVSLLLSANAAAMRVKEVRFANSNLELLREQKTLLTTAGTNVTQTMVRVGPTFYVTAMGSSGDFQGYEEELAPRALGWEYVESLDMPGQAERWASIAAQKLTARSVDPGEYDLIIEPTNLWLTLHESIGHPTELDRAIGLEANFAGTSFLAPPEAVIGKFRYGPSFMNVQADRTQEGSLSRVAWDDEGVPADQWLLVERGVFKDYQTTREQVARIQKLTGVSRSHGCSFADSWGAVQFQRMPNISLLPGEEDIDINDIISDTRRGILIRNRGSWSIDHQRYNFQFSGQAFYEVLNGKIGGMLKDVAYQSNTPVFWNSMDLIGGPSSYWMGGVFNDGKGEPPQNNSVSHGCVPARFRNVTVLNTGRAA